MHTESKLFQRLSLFQLFLVLLGMVVGPLFGAAISYTQSTADMSKQFVQERLESERTFVHREDFKEVSDKLDTINNRLSNIEGFMRKNQR